MKNIRFIPLFMAAVLAFSAAVGCTSNKNDPNISNVTVEPGKLEGIADKEISIAPNEQADENQTKFTLNSVIDSGATDGKGGRYIYLDVTISNATDKAYDLSVLNNFYLLLPDETEVHFDVRTQLHATKNIESYTSSPFTIPANGDFSGLIGGFIVDQSISDFTVCFFPTQDDERNKSSVVKVKITPADIKTL